MIFEPDVIEWQHLSSNDSYLVVALDGIFERVNMQDIYSLLLKAWRKNNQSIEYLPTNVHALALAMVNVSFDRGSMDNLIIVVLDLNFTTHFA